MLPLTNPHQSQLSNDLDTKSLTNFDTKSPQINAIKLIGGKLIRTDDKSKREIDHRHLDILPPIDPGQIPAEPNIALWREIHRLLLYYDRHQFSHLLLDLEQRIVVIPSAMMVLATRYNLPIPHHLFEVLMERFMNADPPNTVNYHLLIKYLINCQSPPPPHGPLTKNLLPVPEIKFTVNAVEGESNVEQKIDFSITINSNVSKKNDLISQPNLQRCPVLPLGPISHKPNLVKNPEDIPLEKNEWIKRFDKMSQALNKVPQKKTGYLQRCEIISFIEPYDLVYNLQLILPEIRDKSVLTQVSSFLQEIKQNHLAKNYPDLLESRKVKEKIKHRSKSSSILEMRE